MTEQITATHASGVRPDLFLLGQEPSEIAVPECEAERRIRQALHTMEVDWGRGVFDYGKIRALFTSRSTETCLGGHRNAERPTSAA
ncbi:hypothetical protein [Arthrobacter sp. ZGTC412]|uniref:hypothetical protein n=1 Tax=Arthrobacter sp. ZGTC412 TaxID=2058900 RepID=UPI000CE381F8|nr:hypothetical protein [Arthrobacter sp. ZGTC412]